MSNMQWYQYRQNNSGGSYQIDDDVSILVLIEAPHSVDANAKAQHVGIYFNGCEDGLDCDCCGDRWHKAHRPLHQFATWGRLFDGPLTIHDTVQSYAQTLADECWSADVGQPVVIVYHADGKVERFYKRDAH